MPDPTPRLALDTAIDDLRRHASGWAQRAPIDRVPILNRLSRGFDRVADRWVHAVLAAEGLDEKRPEAGEEWLVGPYMVLRNIHLLRRSMIELEENGRPKIPGPISTRPDGQVVARVFPENAYDVAFYPGMTAEVWMQPDVTLESLPTTQAGAYRDGRLKGRVALVLGGGNVSSIGPMDVLTKLFVDNTVVLFKVHPVNAYLGPLLEEAFLTLVDEGVLRVVYGGADVGEYLSRHEGIDEIHVTGSDRTFEAIVFGGGEDGARRKERGEPLTDKTVTGELGNVSPVIVVPGPWSRSDLRYQAINVASMIANNAGFNCNAGRVLVQHAAWPQRKAFLDEIRRVFSTLPTRRAYYPGAEQRQAAIVTAHPEAEQIGQPSEGELPWTFVPDVPATQRDDVCFRVEAFCAAFAETALEADDVPAFLDAATAFCNDTLWGTLNATLVVHPKSLRDPHVARAVDRAIARLRYGTVCVNHWAALGYGLGITPWGAFPGHTIDDIQSGIGVVHNTLMFDKPQKTVVRTRFRAFPKPPWFVDHRTAHRLARRLTHFEARPSLIKLPRITWEALRA